MAGRKASETDVNVQAEGVSYDGINGHMLVTKLDLQDGQYQIWFNLESDGFRQVYKRMALRLSFQICGGSYVLCDATALRPHPVMGLKEDNDYVNIGVDVPEFI